MRRNGESKVSASRRPTLVQLAVAHCDRQIRLRWILANEHAPDYLGPSAPELSATHADPTFLAAGAGGPMGDLADQANADAEADLHIRLYQSDAHLLRAIEDALARITRDRFGVCEMCGAHISKARLEAVPWTRLYRDCKEREQSAA